jgi:hypothetical protein
MAVLPASNTQKRLLFSLEWSLSIYGNFIIFSSWVGFDNILDVKHLNFVDNLQGCCFLECFMFNDGLVTLITDSK